MRRMMSDHTAHFFRCRMQEIDRVELERWAKANFGIPESLDFGKLEHRIALGRSLDRFVSIWPAFFAAWKSSKPGAADAEREAVARVLREAVFALEKIGSMIEDDRPPNLSDVENEPREVIEERLRDWQRWSKRVDAFMSKYPTLEMDEQLDQMK